MSWQTERGAMGKFVRALHNVIPGIPLVIAVACTLLACGGTSSGAATPTPTVSAVIVARSNTITIEPGTSRLVTVSCDAGEVLVGGGFASDPWVSVTTSYPINLSTWTVAAYDYGGEVPLTAYANCVQAN